MPDHYGRLFLLSHMRALTSLAGHILGSHAWVNGYFEMHISYDDASALDRQLEVLKRYETLKANSRYIFDKLLHDDYRLDLERLGLHDPKLLVSLLEPEQTIKSIVALFRNRAEKHRYASAEEATNYYVRRIETLGDFCRSTDRSYYYYDADLLRSAPETLLPRLAGWLELDPPLSEHYRIFSETGKARKGDSSEFIRSGTIQKSRNDYSGITIPQQALRRARTIYRDCRAQIVAGAADYETGCKQQIGNRDR
jgi:hypothetical protein